MTNKIFHVPVDAPLWGGTPEATLNLIIEKLSSASYHYADDSTGEWTRARNLVREAAALANEHKLAYNACLYLYSHKSQLVSFEQFMDAILKDARK